jgi:hypothetical protein
LTLLAVIFGFLENTLPTVAFGKVLSKKTSWSFGFMGIDTLFSRIKIQ